MTQVPFKHTPQDAAQDSTAIDASSTADSSLTEENQFVSSEETAAELRPSAQTISPTAGQPDSNIIMPTSYPPDMGMQFSSTHSGQSLRKQLLQTVLPLALVPLAVVSFIDYTLSQNQSQRKINQELQGQALLASETISQAIINQFDATTSLTDNPLVLDRVRSGSRKADAEDLSLSRQTVNDIEEQFASTKLLEPSQTFNAYLDRVAKTQGFKELLITERNGLNVGFNAPTTDFLQADEEWWQQGKAQGRWISDPTFDTSAGGGFGINMSQSIQDPQNGSFLGVLKVFVPAVQFQAISDYLNHAGIRGSQEVQILDASLGSVLVSFTVDGEKAPENSQDSVPIVGSSLIAEIATRIATLNQAGAEVSLDAIRRDLQTEFSIRNLAVSKTSHTDKGYEDQQSLLVSFVHGDKQYAISALPVLDWVAVASMDVAEIRAESQGLLVAFIVVGLVMGGVAAGLTVGLARRLSAALNALSVTAQQVAEGNLDVSAELRGSLETRTLARTFNELVFRVKGFLAEQTLNTRRVALAAAITGAKVVDSEELLSVFASMVEETRDILASDRVVIYRFNPDGSGNIVAESVAAGLLSAYEQGITDACIPEETRDKYLTDGVLLINDVAAATNLHPEHLALLEALQVKSVLGVAIARQGKLYGLLITHYCHSTHAWQSTEIDFLKQLGLQVGLVIERVTLLEQTRELAEEQRQLKEGLQRNALQLLMDVDPVSQGNLTVRAKVTEDEIGTIADSYNATIANLRKIVVQMQDAAQQVVVTTDTNQTSVRMLSIAAAQQAQEILTALEQVQEMANSVRTVAVNAEKAEVAVQQAAQTVQEGDEAMNRTVDGILAIRETVAETAKKVKRLGESSQKISNVVNLISGFAAQTNMLALNASIEASRAGEEGKGFAVVAEEVRSLARQSSEATTEIEKLVANIQAETNEVVMAMESGTEQVVAGTRLVDDTRQSLNKITAASRQISQLVEAIAQATIVQSQTSETVTETMATVATIANQNSTAAGQVSESFEQLRSVAQTLQEEVKRFKVN